MVTYLSDNAIGESYNQKGLGVLIKRAIEDVMVWSIDIVSVEMTDKMQCCLAESKRNKLQLQPTRRISWAVLKCVLYSQYNDDSNNAVLPIFLEWIASID